MRRTIVTAALIGAGLLVSCSKKDTTEPPKTAVETPAAAPAPLQPGGPHAFVHLTDGSKVPGTVVASSQTDLVLAGDDGIERKIPLAQVKSVEYGPAQPTRTAVNRPPASSAVPEPLKKPSPEGSSAPAPAPAAPATAAPDPEPRAAAPAPPPPPPVTTRTFEVPVGAEVSVRTNELID